MNQLDQGSRKMIEASNITKRYGRIVAVEDVSFHVDRHEVVGLLGPNGAGKTTTMRILTGFLPATSGTATVAGLDVAQHPTAMKRQIGYLPEQPPLYPEMRVSDYLLYVASLKLVEKSKRRAAVDKAMQRCGLTDRKRQRIEHLSKGYRQRVGIAQAIVHEPQLVILDEPTVGLDPQQVIGVRELIRELAEQLTVLVSSHILSEIEATCGRVIIINEGRVIAEDSPGELQARLNRQTGNLLYVDVGGRIDATLESLGRVPGVQSIENVYRNVDGMIEQARCRVVCDDDADPRNDIAQCIIESGGQLLGMHMEQSSLEDVFLRLVGEGGQKSKPKSWRTRHEPDAANL